MLNTVFLNADEFLFWIGKGRAPKSRRLSSNEIRKNAAKSFCALILPDQKSEARSTGVLIAVDPLNIRDFYAFLSTYVADYVPFTSFFRVISTDKLGIIEDSVETAHPLNKDLINNLVGVPIAEAALYMRIRGSGSDSKAVTLPAVNATYSAAVLQALVRFKSVDIAAIAKGWSDSRSFLGSEPLPLSIDDLASFWDVITCALLEGKVPSKSEDAVIVSALRKAISAGSVREDMLDDLFSTIPELNKGRPKFGATREDQARAVQEVIAIIGSNTRPAGQLENCLAGCLLSLLGDGSFKFLPSALALAPNLSTAPLWFGVWAGLQDANDLMTRFNCLGRRLVRDIRAHSGIYSIPTADISIDELSAGVHTMELINRVQSRAIMVEIYPNISSRQSLISNPIESSAPNPRIRSDVVELKHLINRSLNFIERIESNISSDEVSRIEQKSMKTKGGRWTRS